MKPWVLRCRLNLISQVNEYSKHFMLMSQINEYGTDDTKCEPGVCKHCLSRANNMTEFFISEGSYCTKYSAYVALLCLAMYNYQRIQYPFAGRRWPRGRLNHECLVALIHLRKRRHDELDKYNKKVDKLIQKNKFIPKSIGDKYVDGSFSRQGGELVVAIY